jgi:hypothetical protein
MCQGRRKFYIAKSKGSWNTGVSEDIKQCGNSSPDPACCDQIVLLKNNWPHQSPQKI